MMATKPFNVNLWAGKQKERGRRRLVGCPVVVSPYPASGLAPYRRVFPANVSKFPGK